MRRARQHIALLASTLSLAAVAAEFQPGHYRVESRMVLPHLEEMRRVVDQHDVCVPTREALFALFPVARQPAMIGCRLRPLDNSDTGFVLSCDAVNGAEGHARLSIDMHSVDGELNAKMGGKNMTFSQFIKAERLGPCP